MCQSQNSPEPFVSLIADRPATTSLKIAEHFGKQHKNVLRDIEALIADCPANFTELNFEPSNYTDSTGRKLPMYYVFFDGFILLVMGYTGPKALAMKLAYIGAFNAMRAELEKRIEQPQLPPNGADAPITPDQQCTLQGIVKAKVDAIPEAERNTRGLYPQVWQRFNNHFRLAKYAQLPQSRMSEAVEYLVKMELKPVKPIEPKKELPPAREKLPAKDKYESYMEEVEAFRARSAAEIEILLSKGLDLVNVYKFGPGGIKGFTTILLDWLQSVAGQHAPLIRYREPIDRAIVYSPLFLMKHMEAVLPDLRK